MPRILLIEDELFIADLYKIQFEKTGFTIDVASMGNDGLALLSQNQYDLILLDIMLPDLNGIDILKKIKQIEAAKNIPVVLLTNLAQDDIIKEGLINGASGYLIKAQHTPEQLIQEVKNMLSATSKPQQTTS